MIKTLTLIACVAAILGIDGYVAKQLFPDDILAGFKHEKAETEYVYFMDAEVAYETDLAAATATHKPLRMISDMPGQQDPELVTVDQVDVLDSAEVVGVEVDGKPHAFLLNAMLDPTEHIVNLTINQTPISVTYCDMVDCVRVLSSEGNASISLGFGGVNDSSQMVFLFNGQRYDQDSNLLPLQDYPFVRSTFGAWKSLHPESKVYANKRNHKTAAKTRIL